MSLIFKEAMREFLGVSIPMIRANEASAKEHYQAYKSVLEKLSLPMFAGTRIYESRYARHFYPDDVRAELRKKWISTNQAEMS